MRFTPQTKEEINEGRLVPEGVYQFEVTEAVDAISSKGNEMIKMFVKLYKPDGKSVVITDYLMETTIYKLLHFCEAVGLEDDYHAGDIKPEKFIGKTGECKVKIRKSYGYPDQNQIADYIPAENAKESRPVKKTKAQMAHEAQKPDDFESDEIPF